MSYISEIQDTIPRAMNYIWKDLLQKKVNLCCTETEQPRVEETHATQSNISMDPVH